MLRGLDKRISLKTDLPVYVAEDPFESSCPREQCSSKEH